MGDDPYDFDIAIPSGGGVSARYGGGGGKGREYGGGGAHSGGASDSDDGGGNSDASVSSDSDRASYQRKKETAAPTQQRASGGRGGGEGGTSALDKAKSFLSKYSSKATPSKTVPSSSGRSRRVEMSLDDEDFSLDSSGEAIKKSSKATIKSAGKRKDSSESDHEDEEGEEDDISRSALSRDVFSDEDASASAVESVAPKATAAASAHEVEEASRDASDDDDRPVFEPTTTTTTALPTRTNTATASIIWGPSNVKKASVSDDDDEVESIASQSDVEESVDARRPSVTAPALAPSPLDVAASMAASESGAYEDDDFDEVSMSVPHQAAKVAVPLEMVAAHANDAVSKDDDSHAQYSLDFVDDADLPTGNEPAKYQSSIRQLERDEDDKHDARSNASSSSDRSKDSFVEEHSEDEAVERALNPVDAADRDEDRYRSDSAQGIRQLANEQSEEYSQDDRFESESAVHIQQPPNQQLKPNVVIGKNLFMQQTASTTTKPSVEVEPTRQFHHLSPPPPSLPDQREKARPRVQIVREYEYECFGVETRDASTQFTGNHASIQTDLTPDGMTTTTAERRRSREPSAGLTQHGDDKLPGDKAGVKDVPLHAARSEIRQAEATLPPPPPSVYATYGLYDPLQLPTGTSMSTYKQQLLALQQQIHQKKLETERLFRDRIASRYTSLRGTERFLSSNRPPRMPLWEALVRVDPTLDEAKAREIARMASDGAA